MYCRNCGKELPDNSNFCPECGTKQNVIPDNKIYIPKFIKKHQKLSYAYVAWCLIHFTLFISSSKRIPEGFYPWDKPLSTMLSYYWEGKESMPQYFSYSFSLFDESNVYDILELFSYTILFPIIIYGLVKLCPFILLYLKQAKKRYIKWKEANAEKEEEHTEILSEESQEKPNDITQFGLGWTGKSLNQDKEVPDKDDQIDNPDTTQPISEKTTNERESSGEGCMIIAVIICCTLFMEFIILIIPYRYLPPIPKTFMQMAIIYLGVYFVRLYLKSNKGKSGGEGCMTITAIIGCTFLLEFIILIIPYSYLPALPKTLIQVAIGYLGVCLIRLYLKSNNDKDDGFSEEQHDKTDILQDVSSDIKINNDNNTVYDDVVKDEIAESVEDENEYTGEDDIESHTKKKIFIFILASILFVGSIAVWQYWPDIAKYITDNSTICPPKVRMCPELIKIANELNSKAPFTLTDGMEIAGVTYKDTVFTVIYQIDSEIVPFNQINAFQKDQKHTAIAAIRASTGKTREEYEKYVEYHVTKVDKFIDKRTGRSITTTISPSEIKTALQEPLSALGRLEQYINMQKKILPYEIEEGFIAKKIEMAGGQVVMDISVDEDMYDFYDIIEIEDEFRSNLINQLTMDPVWKMLCKYLGEAHYGLSFRYYGNQSYLEMFVSLDADDIIDLLED